MTTYYSLVERLRTFRDRGQKVMTVFFNVKENITHPRYDGENLCTTEHAYNILGEFDIDFDNNIDISNSKKRANDYFRKQGVLQVHVDKVSINTELPIQYFASVAFEALRNAWEKINDEENDHSNNTLTDQLKFTNRVNYIKRNILTWIQDIERNDRSNSVFKQHKDTWLKMNNAQQNAFLEECMQLINQNNIQAQAHFSQAQITYQRILIEEMGGQIDEEEVEREKEREATLIRERAQEAAREAAEQVRERQQEEAARQLRLNRSPELPPNNIDYTAENSLNSIDNVTLDECHLGYVSHIKTIPTDFKLEWTNAYSLVLSRVLRDLEQPSKIILTRSIKWLLVLHHILLRKPKRGSENDRQGTTILMMRFRQWHEGDYISLLDEWLKDREKNRTRKEPPNKSLEEKIQINEIKSNSMILEGYMQRGLRNLC